MVSQEIERLADEVFKTDSKIVHIGLIDLEGHILLDQSSGATKPNEPDTDRIMFYYQVGLRRSRREHFDDFYGKTEYVHIIREKIQQMILYLPLITIYLTLDKSVTPDEVKVTAQRIENIDSKSIENAIKSQMFKD
ncbi:MAG: hypothetical protein OER82_02145 [Nitrosopumilus sp.]|nr:hypothetical protein [Nitrosopumilus sp.]